MRSGNGGFDTALDPAQGCDTMNAIRIGRLETGEVYAEEYVNC
jgi:hypothetical protein